MANQKEIEACYDWFHQFEIMTLGKDSDLSCAFFDGDFSKTLDQAQKDKHDWVLEWINFKPKQRILDIGCGTGSFLKTINEKGGYGLGFTLSGWQARYCQNKGLEVRIQDYKTSDPKELEKIEGVVSIGALEHFCSVKEFQEGKQDEIYGNFFKFCADVLPEGGKLYLHMMTWGKKVPNLEDITLDAPKDSDEIILARTIKFYPGSWLPAGKDQLIEDAKPYFKFISSNNGRLDYIETLARWEEATRKLYTTWKIIPASIAAIKLLPRYLAEPDFRIQIAFLTHSDQSECFKREIMSHERMFFEKRYVTGPTRSRVLRTDSPSQRAS